MVIEEAGPPAYIFPPVPPITVELTSEIETPETVVVLEKTKFCPAVIDTPARMLTETRSEDGPATAMVLPDAWRTVPVAVNKRLTLLTEPAIENDDPLVAVSVDAPFTVIDDETTSPVVATKLCCAADNRDVPETRIAAPVAADTLNVDPLVERIVEAPVTVICGPEVSVPEATLLPTDVMVDAAASRNVRDDVAPMRTPPPPPLAEMDEPEVIVKARPVMLPPLAI